MKELLASFLYRRQVASRGPGRWLWTKARGGLIRFAGDPSCRMEAHGRRLEMPLSHSLPAILSRHPCYDTLPGRLAAFLRDSGAGHLVTIDVGANIGDTVAAMRPEDADLYLALEPCPRFRRFLEKNWRAARNVVVLDAACGETTTEARVSFRTALGTARMGFENGPATTGVRVVAIDDLLSEQPRFARPDLIKIDTDGHDFAVLRGARRTIARVRPAVLFECDIFGNPRYIEETLETPESFHDAGYESVIVYDNFGYLAGRYSLADRAALEALLFYQATSEVFYFDLLLPRPGDDEAFHRAEREFFARTHAKAGLDREKLVALPR